MAASILEAYEGTLEEDFPPESERYEHSEMLLYKVRRVSHRIFGNKLQTLRICLTKMHSQYHQQFMESRGRLLGDCL